VRPDALRLTADRQSINVSEVVSMQASVVDGVSAETSGNTPAVPLHAQVIQMATGYWVSRAIYVAAQLGIADLLKDGAQDAETLAAATGTYAPALRRVLRSLASVGLFRSDAQHRFSLTPVGAALRSDAPGAARSTVIALSGGFFWASWGEVLHSVRTGETGIQKALGVSEYEYLAEHPEDASHFNAAMIGYHGQEPAAIVEAYNFSGSGTVVDVGGGSGTLLGTILATDPNLQGVLHERPQVITEAEQNLKAAGVADRCEFVGGDFLEAVPPGGDIYIVSHCIHNWNEQNCVRILANCRRAMAPRGRLLIIEAVISPGDAPDPAKLLDLAMLVVPGGEERTEDEYRTLLEKSGFRLTRVIPTQTSSASIIEAIPV
jgi:ubiquinone/menaquinone biosynthesis C-methylase UbiE